MQHYTSRCTNRLQKNGIFDFQDHTRHRERAYTHIHLANMPYSSFQVHQGFKYVVQFLKHQTKCASW